MVSESVYSTASTKKPQLSNAVQHSVYCINYDKCIWFCMASVFILLKVIWLQLNPMDRKCFWTGEEVSSASGATVRGKPWCSQRAENMKEPHPAETGCLQANRQDQRLPADLSFVPFSVFGSSLQLMLSPVAVFTFFPLVLSIVGFLMTSKHLRLIITLQKVKPSSSLYQSGSPVHANMVIVPMKNDDDANKPSSASKQKRKIIQN